MSVTRRYGSVPNVSRNMTLVGEESVLVVVQEA